MEWAIEKCTELGVSRIVPVIARRTDAHLAAAAVKRVERWRRIALQAAEQSRRATPPEIADPIKLQEAVAHARPPLRVVLAESEQQTLLTRLAFVARARRNCSGHRSRRWLDRRRAESISAVRMDLPPPWVQRSCAPKLPPSLPRRSQFLSSQAKRCPFAFRRSCQLPLAAEFSQPSSDILTLMPPSKSNRRSSPFIPDERQREAIEHVHGPMLVRRRRWHRQDLGPHSPHRATRSRGPRPPA